MANYPTITQAYPARELPPDYGTINTKMEDGYIQTRARSTIAPRIYTIIHEYISGADVATWLTFWNAQKGGALSFNYTDPRTAAVVVCRFAPDQVPEITRVGADTYTIQAVRLVEAL